MSEQALVPCAECGMTCKPGEYHPYAACLMFKACHDSTVVRANLEAVRESRADTLEVPASVPEFGLLGLKCSHEEYAAAILTDDAGAMQEGIDAALAEDCEYMDEDEQWSVDEAQRQVAAYRLGAATLTARAEAVRKAVRAIDSPA